MANYEYGCVMLKLDIPKWNEVLKQIKKEDIIVIPEENIKGLEQEPHVTVLFGLHADVDNKKVIEMIKSFSPIQVIPKKINYFSSELYDVLKLEVESKQLNEYRKKLMDAFDNTQDFPDYEPHITIAYLKPNMAKKYQNKNLKKVILKSNKFEYSLPNQQSKYINV